MLNEGEIYLTLTFIVRIAMQVVGYITLTLENNSHLKLKDCLYIVEFRKNLISISS